MNAEEIYKKYVAPEPEPEPEESVKDTLKELSGTTITYDPANWATPNWTTTNWQNLPMTGGGGLTATEHNSHYNTHKPLAFVVDDVQLVKDYSTFGYDIIVKMLCTLGDYHFVYEKVVDDHLLRDQTKVGAIIDMMTEDAIREITHSMAKHYDMKTKISGALADSTLRPSIPKHTYLGSGLNIQVKTPHPMFNPDAV